MIRWYARWKFSFLLTALVALLVLQAFLEGFAIHDFLFQILYSILLATTVLAFAQQSGLRIFILALGIVTFVASWVTFYLGLDGHTELAIFERMAAFAFLAFTAGIVLDQVLRETHVTVDTLMGSGCAYLLIAAAWGMTYSALQIAAPDSFTMPAATKLTLQSHASNLNEWVDYSFMTFTTLGYVEIQPQSRAAGTLTWLEGMAGQFYLAVLVARLVGLHTVPNTADAAE